MPINGWYNIVELLDCEIVPVINTGDFEKDDKANTELYLKLIKEGDEKGFAPVMIDLDDMKYNYSEYNLHNIK